MAVKKGNNASNTLIGSSFDDDLFGRGGNDRLYGRGGDDYLSGGTGNDRLDGGSGFDDVYGGSGNDKLAGASGDDLLSGGSGNDQILGGTGNDALFGGSGVDFFQFDFADGFDVIYDFNLGIDFIDVSGTGAIDPLDLLFSDVIVNGVLSTEIDYGSGAVTLVGVDQDAFFFSNYDDIIFA
jgi:Ca2+-binding RTX toxin-like protein